MLNRILSVLAILAVIILIIYRLGSSKISIFEYVLFFLIVLQATKSLTEK